MTSTCKSTAEASLFICILEIPLRSASVFCSLLFISVWECLVSSGRVTAQSGQAGVASVCEYGSSLLRSASNQAKRRSGSHQVLRKGS